MLARTFALAVLIAAGPAFADPFDNCAEHLPFGQPSLTEPAHTDAVLHAGYAALVDEDRMVPRWVAYQLTAAVRAIRKVVITFEFDRMLSAQDKLKLLAEI